MSHLIKWLSSLVVALLLVSAMATPAKAWPGDSSVTVKAQGTYSSPAYRVLTCRSATLQVGGRTYQGSVSTNWASWNGCNVQFNSIPVRSGTGTLTVKGTVFFGSPVSGSKSVN